ncbi:hypothetical protein [Streptomyces sp. NPDC058579]
MTAEDPSHIGAYRLIARLGAGGMGLDRMSGAGWLPPLPRGVRL